MDQKKIGLFLKELRKEKGITQEAFSEKLNVSGRTVSRWETGSNLPDISLLAEIAEFYDVDVREIINGERKSEMNEEVKEVAKNMADYATNEKSKILKWVQIAGIIGIIFMTGAIIIQCVTDDSDFFKLLSLVLFGIALIMLVIITLYVNGILEKIVKKKTLVTAVKVLAISLASISVVYIAKMLLVFVIVLLSMLNPAVETQKGIEEYDKAKIVRENNGDLDSGFFVFPDEVDNCMEASYELKLKTGLLDTDGYIILETKYNDADFNEEIQRLQNIVCELEYEDEKVSNKIAYDENMYKYPAYVAIDGHDYNYEYALIDNENNRIIYVYLSYPGYLELLLKGYGEFLKKGIKNNIIDYLNINNNALERFSIYVLYVEELDAWMEYDASGDYAHLNENDLSISN